MSYNCPSADFYPDKIIKFKDGTFFHCVYVPTCPPVRDSSLSVGTHIRKDSSSSFPIFEYTIDFRAIEGAGAITPGGQPTEGYRPRYTSKNAIFATLPEFSTEKKDQKNQKNEKNEGNSGKLCFYVSESPTNNNPSRAVAVEEDESPATRRALKMVRRICKNAHWLWFITLTFDPSVLDIEVGTPEYNEAVKAKLLLFTRRLRAKKYDYILVPEFHESGAIHLHGLLANDLLTDIYADFEKAVNPHTGSFIFHSRFKRQVYNLRKWDNGFSVCFEITERNLGKFVKYITKYVSKSLDKYNVFGRNKKRYWASRNVTDFDSVSGLTFFDFASLSFANHDDNGFKFIPENYCAYRYADSGCSWYDEVNRRYWVLKIGESRSSGLDYELVDPMALIEGETE